MLKGELDSGGYFESSYIFYFHTEDIASIIVIARWLVAPFVIKASKDQFEIASARIQSDEGRHINI